MKIKLASSRLFMSSLGCFLTVVVLNDLAVIPHTSSAIFGIGVLLFIASTFAFIREGVE